MSESDKLVVPVGEHRERSVSRTATICVVGLGYVGLPLAVRFDQAGHDVIGYDIDAEKIETLRLGFDTTGDLGATTIEKSEITYTHEPDEITRADYVMITVPTPVDDNQHPNLAFVESAGETVGEYMSPGTTVILESTVYPGATREVLVPALESASGLECGEDFFVAYSPERATPGDPDHDLRSVVKVVSGQTDEVLEDVAQLYETVVDADVHRAESIETAEACKVVENMQRDVNIALINELAMAFDSMSIDLDIQKVLEAAGTKWNFHPYRPGLVGGHCIPVDPYFFTYQSKREGFVPELTLTGRAVNESMSDHVAMMTVKGLNSCGKTLRQSRILILGITYKPDVADIRTSKIGSVIDRLEEYEMEIVGYDPYPETEAMEAEFDIEFQESLSFDGFDAVLLATPHRQFGELDLEKMARALNDDPLLVDVTGLFDPDDVNESGMMYRSV